MSKHHKGFTQEDKSRITRTETQKFGQIPKGGLGAHVQSLVDTGKGAPSPVPASAAPKK